VDGFPSRQFSPKYLNYHEPTNRNHAARVATTAVQSRHCLRYRVGNMGVNSMDGMGNSTTGKNPVPSPLLDTAYLLAVRVVQHAGIKQ